MTTTTWTPPAPWRRVGVGSVALLRFVVPLVYGVLVAAGAAAESGACALAGSLLGVAGTLTTWVLLRYSDDNGVYLMAAAAGVVLAAAPAACQGAGALGPTGGVLAVLLICSGAVLTGLRLATPPRRPAPAPPHAPIRPPAPEAYRTLVTSLPTDLLVDEWRSLQRETEDAAAAPYLDVLTDVRD